MTRLGLRLCLFRVRLIYVDHLFGRLSDFELVGKYFEAFFISPENLFVCYFKASIGEVVVDVSAQAGVARGEAPDSVAAENGHRC